MAKYVIDEETLNGLGDAIRSVTGSTKEFTPDEMMAEIRDILNATTFMLVDADGNEYAASYIDSDLIYTATANDIRKGCTALTGSGVIEGNKEIPAYYTSEGYVLVTAGSSVKIPKVTDCDYTKLQALFCKFNGNITNSVFTEKVCINDSVYAVASTEALSEVTINTHDQSIDFGVMNDGEDPLIIRYFMYKEVH